LYGLQKIKDAPPEQNQKEHLQRLGKIMGDLNVISLIRIESAEWSLCPPDQTPEWQCCERAKPGDLTFIYSGNKLHIGPCPQTPKLT
jgi:hypothetical protein